MSDKTTVRNLNHYRDQPLNHFLGSTKGQSGTPTFPPEYKKPKGSTKSVYVTTYKC